MTLATTIDAIRHDIAVSFEPLTDAQLVLAAQAELVAHGAAHVPLEPRNTWGPQEHTVTMLGITGMGGTLAEALRDWTKCTLRMHDTLEEERAA